MATLAVLNTATTATTISSSEYNDNMTRIRAAVNTVDAAQLNTDSVTTAKIVDANVTLDKLASDINLVPVGCILPYVSETPPTGYLECDGSSLDTTTYATLYAVIGNSYGAADGTHFNIPDLRGKFPRGYDNGAGNDPNAATRTAQATGGATGDAVGSVQADAFKAHIHTIPMAKNDLETGGTGSAIRYGSTTNSASTGGTETRPINVNVMYIIKY